MAGEHIDNATDALGAYIVNDERLEEISQRLAQSMREEMINEQRMLTDFDAAINAFADAIKSLISEHYPDLLEKVAEIDYPGANQINWYELALDIADGIIEKAVQEANDYLR